MKAEFNSQINASSAVIFIVDNMTKYRTAGNCCDRNTKEWYECYCTPNKKNSDGKKLCKYINKTSATNGNVGNINTYSYLRHEFEQAKNKGKPIIIVYNSTRKESSWLPSYMSGYKDEARPFWKYNDNYDKVGDYECIKGKRLNYLKRYYFLMIKMYYKTASILKISIAIFLLI